jgi:hypothetical protein
LNSVGVSQVFISSFTTAIVGGTTYDPYSELSRCCFTDFSGSVTGFVGSGETCKQLNLTLPGGGGWNFNFAFFPATDVYPAYYLFVNGTLTAGTPPAATPEPGTLGLMATGLAGIIGGFKGGD